MKRKYLYLSVLLFFVVLICYPVYSQVDYSRSTGSSSGSDERENINVYKIASAAVVTIDASYGSGSGCIIDPSGIIVTNRHVINDGYRVKISLSDGTSYMASLIDIDNDDLALLKINANRNFPYVRLGDSSRIEVGQRVLAIGNPFGLERTLTTGIISRIDYKYNRIQTDAAINPGNSGGPLLNTKGELVGVNQAIINPSGRSSAGIGFAIPSNTVKRLLALSKEAKIFRDTPGNYNNVSKVPAASFPPTIYKNKVFLGIAGVNMPNGQVFVSGVAQGSPAEKAGLRYQDIVLALDSVKIKTFNDVGFALSNKNPGDTVNLLYMRNGLVNSSSAVLETRN